jgi:GNAT superfamily N-acetyltransferase
VKLLARPTEGHMAQLLAWLEAEERDTGEGFLCNWNVIYQTFEEGKLYIVEYDSTAIALLAWWECPPNAGIDILTVQPKFRRKGIGRLLVNSFLDKLKKKGVNKVRIQSMPTTSEDFWLSLGFYEEPDNPCERINGIPIQKLYMVKELNDKLL